MTQQTTLQKIRFENGLAVAKSKIEYVMCRIEEIRLQLQGENASENTKTLLEPIPVIGTQPTRTLGRSVLKENGYRWEK